MYIRCFSGGGGRGMRSMKTGRLNSPRLSFVAVVRVQESKRKRESRFVLRIEIANGDTFLLLLSHHIQHETLLE